MNSGILDIASLDGFTPWLSLTGGAFIGLAAVGLLYFNGRIAGMSGILAGVLSPSPGNTLWRAVFIVGLIAGAWIVKLLHPAAMDIDIDVTLPTVILGGFLVGLGTRIGSGCTSGHGVAGVGRLAPRSIVASIVFLASAMLTVYVIRHVLGGA